MSLFLKYGPLSYSYHTRYNSLKELLWILFSDIGIWIVVIPFLFFNGDINAINWCKAILLYIIIYYIFMIWYEIWYIYNDTIAAQKENKPELRIKETISKKFIRAQIGTRILLWTMSLFLLGGITNYHILIITSIIIVISVIVFWIHNSIRNTFRNTITFTWLRFTKLAIILPIIYFCLHTIKTPIVTYTTIFFLLICLELSIYYYNYHYQIKGKFPPAVRFFFRFLASIMLYLSSTSWLFLRYGGISLLLGIILLPSNRRKKDKRTK